MPITTASSAASRSTPSRVWWILVVAAVLIVQALVGSYLGVAVAAGTQVCSASGADRVVDADGQPLPGAGGHLGHDCCCMPLAGPAPSMAAWVPARHVRHVHAQTLTQVTVRIRAMVAVTVTLALVAVVGVYLVLRQWSGHLPRASRTCTVRADVPDAPPGAVRAVTLNAEQMANAATIAAIGVQRRMPERAVVVALATAFQESKLRNLAGGDRDSVGLFQQRPSQGWGTVAQIRDPRYATNTFYAALRKVRGWEEMRVTDAAQAVQRSAFPEAYEQWTDESLVLTRALLGDASGAVACTVAREPAMRGSAAASALAAGLLLDWGNLDTATPAELTGVTVSVGNARAGWRYAHWLVSHASDHGVKRVRFGDLQWTAKDGIWAKAGGGTGAGAQQVVAEVFGDR